MLPSRRFLAAATALCAASVAQAAITTLRIDRIEPFAPGTSFGDAGAYERVVGVARGELDPADPHNRHIVNIDKAPRNAAGKVEYETDFYILRPVDRARGNNKIIYEVNNRGRKFLMHWVLDAPQQASSANNEPATLADAGNGLLFRMGYTIVWSGWDPDAPRTGAGMAMNAPTAVRPDGQPIVRTIREELVSGTRSTAALTFRLNYPSASLDTTQASLTVRRRADDPPTPIAAGGWAYVDERTIKLLPDGTMPEPGSLYELRYPATNPKVTGIGFAATRDFVSFLRHRATDDNGLANPVGPHPRAVLAVGISQSGRYLRDHIVQGFNRDEGHRKVFDGVFAHVSGIGKVFLNDEFAEPARTNTQHEDHLYPENAFPFSSARMRDPVTGRTGALLRGDGFDPLLIEVNTSTEYWQKGASLLHTDPLGRDDADLPGTTRVYMVAGTQHLGKVGASTARGLCTNMKNPHNPSAALRALLVALDEWVTTGRRPPRSRVPTMDDDTLVKPDRLRFPDLPAFEVAPYGNRIELFGDWTNPQPNPARAYVPKVSRVDEDGNEVDGIRLPDIAVPLGTYTGWNMYAAPFPTGELCDRDGSYLPFARTKAERKTSGDPRQSLQERYKNKARYVEKVRKAARKLVEDRFLLQEDALRYEQAAEAQDPVQFGGN